MCRSVRLQCCWFLTCFFLCRDADHLLMYLLAPSLYLPCTSKHSRLLIISYLGCLFMPCRIIACTLAVFSNTSLFLFLWRGVMYRDRIFYCSLDWSVLLSSTLQNQPWYWLVLCVNSTQARVIGGRSLSGGNDSMRSSCTAFSHLVVNRVGPSPWWVVPPLGLWSWVL